MVVMSEDLMAAGRQNTFGIGPVQTCDSGQIAHQIEETGPKTAPPASSVGQLAEFSVAVDRRLIGNHVNRRSANERLSKGQLMADCQPTILKHHRPLIYPLQT